MMPLPKRRSIAGLLLVAGLLPCGCAHGPPVTPPPSAVVAPTDRKADLAAILALLDRGETAAASPRIDALLARDPGDPQARVLRASLDADPAALLGPKSFAYTVKPNETMTALAVRFLGTPLKAYQLARYNGIAVPLSLTAGTTLRIPGVAPRTGGPKAPVRPRTRPVRASAATGAATAAATPTSAAAARADPPAARRARAVGLVALGQGRLDAAIAALRRAATLDPGNPLIQRDLARAQRLAATVRARR